MNKRTTITVLVVLAIVGLVIFFYLKGGDKSNLKPFEALGEVTAQETVKLIGGSGQIVIIEPDFGAPNNQFQEAQINSFRKELKQHKGVTIVAAEKINPLSPQTPQSNTKPSKLRFFEPTMIKPPSPEPGQLSQIANNNAQAKAIVVFMDLPALNDADIRALKGRGAKMLVVSEYRDEYKALFRAQVLHLAVVSRLEPFRETGKKPRTTKDWFDRFYAVITPEKAEALP